MGTARNVERRIERLVDGLAGAMFGGPLHPSEFGIRLLREADLAIEQEPAGPAIPNRYVLTVHTAQTVPDALPRHLEHLLEETAMERGWRLNGPAGVLIEHSDQMARTEISCRSERAPGPRPPWGRLVPQSGAPYQLIYNRVLVGRSEDCDVSIADAEISRLHALIWREGGRIWINDLDSANGTSVDGGTITIPVSIDDGAVVSFGPATFDLRTP
ncbi:FHA domain-containing protein FhaB [bacterium BMS3Abin02]|nr:FHA domain-containing protein FhaB [bacterium BMS3Abin02]GBE22011.1 FHA domain-containing protein FhaB [bacterium BMS3Bbin01]HDH26488.1 DUF2662 domain-containing protein [Actinomycetota bacterium]HDK45710.1 DUF2662 domain-containing protein [Actinomycetota bacterium]HDL49323.1 DUF2662 domain-containing protein [Actinomycetota bacterium]